MRVYVVIELVLIDSSENVHAQKFRPAKYRTGTLQRLGVELEKFLAFVTRHGRPYQASC